MSPPAEPRSGPVQVTFIDFPAAIKVSESFTPLENSYPALLSLLNALSASVSHKLENLPYQYVQGQGFTLSDGGWWYRFVERVDTGTGGREALSEYGPWTLLDCLFGYENLAAELTLGVKWSGANIEVQHNMQRNRDAAAAHRARQIGTHGHSFQQAPLQYASDFVSGSTVPSAIPQDYSQHLSGPYENASIVDPRTLNHPYHDNDFVQQEGDTMMIDIATSPSRGESVTAEQTEPASTRPLIVTTPFIGPVPLDSDDEAEVITPKPTSSTLVASPRPEIIQRSLVESEDAVFTPRAASSTPVARPMTEVVQPTLTQPEKDIVTPELRPSTPATKSPLERKPPHLAQPGDDVVTPEASPSTPIAKSVPEITKPSLAQPKPELLKGPAGITILPAYPTRTSQHAFAADIATSPELGPPPKLFPPPPRATGSPNDRYRQVPRSGGAIRDPNHRPFQYQYGGPDQQLVGGALPTYNQQPRYPYAPQLATQPQFYSPAGGYGQTGYTFNQNQRSGVEHRQLYDPNNSSGVAARGQSRGGRGRGGHDKTAESKRYSNRSQHQTDRRPASSGEGQYFPLDPALEENQTYGQQNTYSGGQNVYSGGQSTYSGGQSTYSGGQNTYSGGQNTYSGGQNTYSGAQSQYTSENTGQYQTQNPYAAALQYDNNRGLGSGNGNGREYHDGYQYGLPAVNNENPTYYAPSTFAAGQQEPFPEFDPGYYPEDLLAPAQMVAPPAPQEQRQPFVPSPLAAEFTPRFAGVGHESGEQGQAAGQEGAFAHHFPQFQQGQAMMPSAPGPFSNFMLMPVPTPTEMLTRLGLPHLTPYERPGQVMAMPMPIPTPLPPAGTFPVPRTRKLGRLDGKTAHWLDEANECAILDDDDEDDVDVNDSRARAKEAKKERKKESLKLKKKAKRAKIREGADMGSGRRTKARDVESENVSGQAGTESTTMTAASTATLALAAMTAGSPTLATAPAPAPAAAPAPAMASTVPAAPTLAAAPATRMSYAAVLAAASAPNLTANVATTTSHAATLAMAPLPTPATSPGPTATDFGNRLEVIIEEDDMMGEG